MRWQAGLVSLIGLTVAVGCSDTQGRTDDQIVEEREALKKYEMEQQKENPPPPGEGPAPN